MSRLTALIVLAFAAVLEAAGDALARAGLRSQANTPRFILFPAAAIVLFLYGLLVNAPPWDFGKLLGVYIVFFFVVAQLFSWIFFHQVPTLSLWVGGAMIVGGGLIITVFQT